ncbi:hypothetical protein ILUMI_15871, partial [Ignelater luminosus]
MISLKLHAIWIGLLLFHNVKSESRTNFKLERLEICKTIKLTGNFSTEGDQQYLTVNVSSPVPLDEHIGVTCDIHTLLANVTAVHLFTVEENNACKALNKYWGEFWYDLLRGAQLPAGVCPIPA